MSVKFKNGDTVRQVVAPIEGQVMRFAFDPQTGEIAYLVGGTDAEGNAHVRSFAEGEIEVAPGVVAP